MAVPEHLGSDEVKQFLLQEQMRAVRQIEHKPHIKLRHVELLIETARHGSFTAAAKIVGVTSAAAGQGIAELERDFGDVRLFDRDTHTMTLTDAGKTLLEKAEQLLDAEDALLCVAATLGNGNTTRRGTPTDQNKTFLSRLNTSRRFHQHLAEDALVAVVFIEQDASHGAEIRFPSTLVADLKRHLADPNPSESTVETIAKTLDLLQVSVIADEQGWAKLADPEHRAGNVFKEHHASRQKLHAAQAAASGQSRY